MKDLINSLNKNQKQAVSIIKGPVLVLAGAGSGKTRTLTYRIANMIKGHKIPAQSILAVTFTNKAAIEMRERLAKLIGRSGSKRRNNFWPLAYGNDFPFIGTFHSFCLSVLKEDIDYLGYNRNFNIADDKDQLIIIKRLIRDQGKSLDRLNPKAISSKISNFKNKLIDPKQAQKFCDNYFEQEAADIYLVYQKELKNNNLVDFDDIIALTLKIWKKNKEILKKYQDRFPYILVDEYQDTNDAQYELINLLGRKNNNVFAVGDDYQSIYAWRGANIKNILDFEKDYSKAKIILLEQNYRSTQNILNAAQNVIDQNPNQKAKKLWTDNSSGEPIFNYEAADEEDEADYIVEKILEMTKKAGNSFKDFAVLYRINAQSRVLEEKFLNKSLPYRIVGGINFYQRAEIKDIIAYLRLISNFFDRLALERIINLPKRNIGKITVKKIIDFAQTNQIDYIRAIDKIVKNPQQYSINSSKALTLENFSGLIKKLSRQSKKIALKDLIAKTIEKSGYDNFLLNLGEEGKIRFENVMELLSVAKKYNNIEGERALRAFLDEVVLATSQENPNQANNVVTLMTLHAAKGLEFKNVFIAGVEEGMLPHSRSLRNPGEMEEERRLCYVGITRAMEKLWLVHTRNRQIFGQVIKGTPSRFIDDISKDLLESHISEPKIGEYVDYPETDSDFYQEDYLEF
ncbi:MAG: AAA family ATPase [Candidatus Moranbacteria bacterium]|nr:AAA family ATPase [Candidatus Moranbacteria bacterium]